MGAKTELGIRPEIHLAWPRRHAVSITKVEDLGRQKVVRSSFAGQPLTIVVPEDGEIPSDPRVTFDPRAIGIYADSWRVGTGA